MHLKRSVLLSSSLLTFIALLVGCAQDTAAPTTVSQTDGSEEATELSQSNTTSVRLMTQAETFTDFECLFCHTNQEQLVALAAPVEEHAGESLSSGPG